MIEKRPHASTLPVEVQVYAAELRARGVSELHAQRSLRRRFPYLERHEAWQAVGHIDQVGLWSRANVEWGFGYRSPLREIDPVEEC